MHGLFCLSVLSSSSVNCVCPPPGESGLGKSTLINSLFLTDLYSKDYPGPSQRIKKTVQVGLIHHYIVPHRDTLQHHFSQHPASSGVKPWSSGSIFSRSAYIPRHTGLFSLHRFGLNWSKAFTGITDYWHISRSVSTAWRTRSFLKCSLPAHQGELGVGVRG